MKKARSARRKVQKSRKFFRASREICRAHGHAKVTFSFPCPKGKQQIPLLNHVPNFKWTYLRAQEELGKVLSIYIDREKAALTIGEVSRVIPAPLREFWSPRIKKILFCRRMLHAFGNLSSTS